VARRVGGFDAFHYGHIAGLGAFLGHIYPVWLKFLGGKGVATFIGVLIGMHLPAAIIFGIVWIGVAATTRFSSLAALSATVTVLLYYLVTNWAGLTVVAIMAALIFLKHHANIRRLLDGQEGKIGSRS
jgi:acyl phosphate:glycerol-3-phosphate acyltransferase